MKQKGFTPIFILIGILVLAMIGGGAYYFSKFQVSKPQIQNQVVSQTSQSNTTSQPASTSETANPDQIGANWKTYTDNKIGIEFKYPNNWYAKLSPAWTFNMFLDDHPFELPQQTELMTSIQINFNEIMNTTTNKKFFQEKTLTEGVKRIASLYDQKTIQQQNVTVGGKKAVQISGVWGPGMLEGHYFKETLIQLDNKLLIVSLSNKEYEDVYNQILSTFKFN